MMFGLGSHTIDQALQLFGRPASVTGFHRSLRGIESKTDDTFTIILQYESKLLVTVKTSVVATMQYPLKFFLRGYDGTFIKYGDDLQESQILAGQTTESPGFGEEPEDTYGVLTTKEKFDDCQTLDPRSKKRIGKYRSLRGEYTAFYEDLVGAIRGKGKPVVCYDHALQGRQKTSKGAGFPRRHVTGKRPTWPSTTYGRTINATSIILPRVLPGKTEFYIGTMDFILNWNPRSSIILFSYHSD